MYELLKRPDIHWHNFDLKIAQAVQQSSDL